MHKLFSAFRMRNSIMILGFLVSNAVFSEEPIELNASQKAHNFMKLYISLTTTGNITVLDLYDDKAQIRTGLINNGAVSETGTINGKQWKQSLRESWYDGNVQLEVSSFQDVVVTENGRNLIISAKRYSHSGCYWDNNYSVLVKPYKNERYKIIAERIGFQNQSFCQLTQSNPSIPINQ